MSKQTPDDFIEMLMKGDIFKFAEVKRSSSLDDTLKKFNKEKVVKEETKPTKRVPSFLRKPEPEPESESESELSESEYESEEESKNEPGILSFEKLLSLKGNFISSKPDFGKHKAKKSSILDTPALKEIPLMDMRPQPDMSTGIFSNRVLENVFGEFGVPADFMDTDNGGFVEFEDVLNSKNYLSSYEILKKNMISPDLIAYAKNTFKLDENIKVKHIEQVIDQVKESNNETFVVFELDCPTNLKQQIVYNHLFEKRIADTEEKDYLQGVKKAYNHLIYDSNDFEKNIFDIDTNIFERDLMRYTQVRDDETRLIEQTLGPLPSRFNVRTEVDDDDDYISDDNSYDSMSKDLDQPEFARRILDKKRAKQAKSLVTIQKENLLQILDRLLNRYNQIAITAPTIAHLKKIKKEKLVHMKNVCESMKQLKDSAGVVEKIAKVSKMIDENFGTFGDTSEFEGMMSMAKQYINKRFDKALLQKNYENFIYNLETAMFYEHLTDQIYDCLSKPPMNCRNCMEDDSYIEKALPCGHCFCADCTSVMTACPKCMKTFDSISVLSLKL